MDQGFQDKYMKENLKQELEVIWQAQTKLGLKGKMKLYTMATDEPWRSKTLNFEFFFGPDEIDAAIDLIIEHYNNGKLPNSSLLLSPIVYDEDKKPLGAAIAWATVFCKGIAKLKGTERTRLNDVKAYSDHFSRGELTDAGLKIIAFAERILKPLEDGTVEGCRELYELCDVDSDEYYNHYVISGLHYLCKNGSYTHPNIDNFGIEATPKTASIQTIKDARQCWNSYDRHNTLYVRFGIDVGNIETNLKYFNLCARNFEFFDATGPMRRGAEETFEFVVQVNVATNKSKIGIAKKVVSERNNIWFTNQSLSNICNVTRVHLIVVVHKRHVFPLCHVQKHVTLCSNGTLLIIN